MTDQNPIDAANATIMSAEVQALTDFNAKYTAFLADTQAILASLGTGGPQTSARTFLASMQGQFGPILAPQLHNVMVQYGLLTQPTMPTMTTTGFNTAS